MSFPIGERDARLLRIRERHFGPVFQNISNCSACGEKIEWENLVDDLMFQEINDDVEIESLSLDYDDHQISFRLPNSQDVLEVINLPNIYEQEDQLIQKCLVKSTLSNNHFEDIQKDIKDELLLKMEEHDPQANIIMNLSCPECKNEWKSTFDIMEYLWTEINEWGIQMMKDIYLLAQNFGWSEKAILEMSRFRRNLYINMLNG